MESDISENDNWGDVPAGDVVHGQDGNKRKRSESSDSEYEKRKKSHKKKKKKQSKKSKKSKSKSKKSKKHESSSSSSSSSSSDDESSDLESATELPPKKELFRKNPRKSTRTSDEETCDKKKRSEDGSPAEKRKQSEEIEKKRRSQSGDRINNEKKQPSPAPARRESSPRKKVSEFIRKRPSKTVDNDIVFEGEKKATEGPSGQKEEETLGRFRPVTPPDVGCSSKSTKANAESKVSLFSSAESSDEDAYVQDYKGTNVEKTIPGTEIRPAASPRHNQKNANSGTSSDSVKDLLKGSSNNIENIISNLENIQKNCKKRGVDLHREISNLSLQESYQANTKLTKNKLLHYTYSYMPRITDQYVCEACPFFVTHSCSDDQFFLLHSRRYLSCKFSAKVRVVTCKACRSIFEHPTCVPADVAKSTDNSKSDFQVAEFLSVWNCMHAGCHARIIHNMFGKLTCTASCDKERKRFNICSCGHLKILHQCQDAIAQVENTIQFKPRFK